MSEVIVVNAYVSEPEHLPRVEISTLDERFKLDIDAQDAGAVALLILRKAEEAKVDASLVRWALDMSPERPSLAGSLMDSLREFRDRLEIDARNREEEI